jgi:integrase
MSTFEKTLAMDDFTRGNLFRVAKPLTFIRLGGHLQKSVAYSVRLGVHFSRLYMLTPITSLEDPLFVGFDRWYNPTTQRISDKLIERTVQEYGRKIGVDLTPHDLRASFITLAMEGDTLLHQAQYAAGHSNPRTTE